MDVRIGIIQPLELADLSTEQLLALHRELSEELLTRAKRAEELIQAATKAKLGVTPDLNRSEEQLVADGKKVEAIKNYRDRLNALGVSCSLKEAKDAIDAYADRLVRVKLLRSGAVSIPSPDPFLDSGPSW